MTTGARRALTLSLALAMGAPLVASSSASALGSNPRAINPHSVKYSVVLEDQLLAYLRFLPVSFVPRGHTPPTTTTTSTTSTTTPTTTTSVTTTTNPSTSTTSSTTTTVATTTTKPPAAPRRVSPVVLQAGKYVWRFTDLPGAFKSNWKVGTLNVVLKGALMRFQAQHNLPVTGNMDGTSWLALVTAALRHQYSNETYNVVIVNRALPQRLWLYRNGKMSFSSAVNTGISVAPTATGTYTVYLRYKVTTMSGTLPDGKPYHDTGIPWTSYFNGGDALHGFIRSSYGWPQSLGCVEMPFQDAKVLWPYTPLGTLVTVE
jgi:lipoprotein-anchoring transpeptidase ErfK/SrfK